MGKDNDVDVKTKTNEDGSVTTITTKKGADGKVTKTAVTEGMDGSIYTEVVITDEAGNVLSIATEKIEFDTDGTKTVTKTVEKADGYKMTSVETTTSKGKITRVTDEVTPKNKKIHTEEVVKPNGSVTVSTVETNTKGNTKLKSYVKDFDGKETVKMFSVKKDGTVRLEYLETEKKVVKVPDTVKFNGKTYKVNSIAEGAFAGNTTVTSIKLGPNIKYIGAGAFDGATSLSKITIDTTNLKKVFDGAFAGIPKDTKIYLKALSNRAFRKAKSKLQNAGLSKTNKVKRAK